MRKNESVMECVRIFCSYFQKRALFRWFRKYLFFFTFHQFVTIPLLLSVLLFNLGSPSGDIGRAYSDYQRFKEKTRVESLPPAEGDFSYLKNFVLTAGSKYAALSARYRGMELAEKRPRRRTLLPFPFAMWEVYQVEPGSCDSGVRIIASDWESRQVCAFISEQEDGDFRLLTSFIPDVLIYLFWISALIVYVKRHKRAEKATFERFENFRDACLEYYGQTGRFPDSIETLNVGNKSEFRDAFYRREFLCLSRLGIGVIGATAKSWSAPFAFLGLRRRMLVALEDGTIINVRRTQMIRLFNDVVWAARKWENVGFFYGVQDQLIFEENGFRAKRVFDACRMFSRIFILLLFFGASLFLASIAHLGTSRGFFTHVFISSILYTIMLLLGLYPLPILDFYAFMAHTIWGWI